MKFNIDELTYEERQELKRALGLRNATAKEAIWKYEFVDRLTEIPINNRGMVLRSRIIKEARALTDLVTGNYSSKRINNNIGFLGPDCVEDKYVQNYYNFAEGIEDLIEKHLCLEEWGIKSEIIGRKHDD